MVWNGGGRKGSWPWQLTPCQGTEQLGNLGCCRQQCAAPPAEVYCKVPGCGARSRSPEKVPACCSHPFPSIFVPKIREPWILGGIPTISSDSVRDERLILGEGFGLGFPAVIAGVVLRLLFGVGAVWRSVWSCAVGPGCAWDALHILNRLELRFMHLPL